MAFDGLKRQFTEAPILAHCDGQRETTVETDASDYGVGAVLLQRGEDSLLRPITHILRTMNSAERNYDVFNKEALAIIFALTEWRLYLLSLSDKFNIIRITEHFSTS
jgi:hypothetical protein